MKFTEDDVYWERLRFSRDAIHFYRNGGKGFYDDSLDGTQKIMKRLGCAWTREKYIELAFLDPDYTLSAEEESMLPDEFQLPED